METRRTIVAPDGAGLAYWLWRSGAEPAPPLVLLHGAASNHTRWSEFLEATSLKGSMDVLRPDLRGNGASMARGRLDLEIWSRDLGELLDAERYASAVVAGHSLGAQIALDFAHRFPGRVDGLVLLDPVFRRALTGTRKLISGALPLFKLASWLVRGLNALGLHRRAIDAERDLRQLDESTRTALRGGESHHEIARRYSALGPILRHMPLANYLQQLVATVAATPALERIEAPTLVLLSSGITFADPAVNHEEIERFPRATTVAIDANHWPLTERPEEVRQAIERWLGSENGPRAIRPTALPA